MITLHQLKRGSMKKLSIQVLLTIMIAVVPVYAHEGHGNLPGNEVLHYLTSPLHLLVLLAAIIGVVYFIRTRKSSKNES